MYFWPGSSPSTLAVALIVERKKIVMCSRDSVIIVLFAKSSLKVSKIQAVILGIPSLSLKFSFKNDLLRIHCFVTHNSVENLVVLICVENRKHFLTLRWLVKRDANCHPVF